MWLTFLKKGKKLLELPGTVDSCATSVSDNKPLNLLPDSPTGNDAHRQRLCGGGCGGGAGRGGGEG